MDFFKKFLSFFVFFVFSVFGIFAMPGFSSLIKDKSGEFVYYRDYSFPQESYIGILYYSEDSIQVRYYRPLNKEQKVPEKEITILFSVNPEIDYFELTGELIMSTILPETEDVDIVNYLHDILYEFSARRIKQENMIPDKIFFNSNDFLSSGIKSAQNYEQFGGEVTVVFDPIIPIFNIKSIFNGKNEPVLSCVTFGALQNSADSTFDHFTGFPENKNSTASVQSIINSKNSRSVNYATEDGQYVTLDQNWSQAMDNLWLCGNESLLTINKIPAIKNDGSSDFDLYADFAVIRKLLQSSGSSYTNLAKCEIIRDAKKNCYRIIQFSYQPKIENRIINRKIITKDLTDNSPKSSDSKGGFYYFALTVFEDYYYQNKNYYDKIIKSYKIKQN